MGDVIKKAGPFRLKLGRDRFHMLVAIDHFPADLGKSGGLNSPEAGANHSAGDFAREAWPD